MTAPAATDGLPAEFRPQRSRADIIFRGVLMACAGSVLAIILGILFFLSLRSRLAWDHRGFGTLTGTLWSPSQRVYGLRGDLIGSVVIAVVALLLAAPIAIAVSLAINEYLPLRLRPPMVALVDLLAAVPSLIYGLWGLYFLNGHLFLLSKWLGHHGAAFPLFRLVSGAPTQQSEFDAGVVVAVMILPLMTSISREIMSQVPREDCEAALALGGTRWGMIVDVVLPFSRNGVISGALLAFGRALGETIAVAFVLGQTSVVTSHILNQGGGSMSAAIANYFAGSSKLEQSSLTLGALALFVGTLSVGVLARLTVARTARKAAR